MATKTIITVYNEIESVLPDEILDRAKLLAAGGRIIEEFTVEVVRGSKEKPKTETDYLVKFACPADKIDQFGGNQVQHLGENQWAIAPVKKEDHAITEEVDEPDPVETFGLDESDPLFATKLAILQAERDAQLANEAAQKAAQEAAALAAKLAADEALTAKALAVKAIQKKNKKLAVADALAELQAKSAE